MQPEDLVILQKCKTNSHTQFLNYLIHTSQIKMQHCFEYFSSKIMDIQIIVQNLIHHALKSHLHKGLLISQIRQQYHITFLVFHYIYIHIPDLATDKPCLITSQLYLLTEYYNKTYLAVVRSPSIILPSLPPSISKHLTSFYPAEILSDLISLSYNAARSVLHY